MPILATSTGLSLPKAQKKFSEALADVSPKNALMITTASRKKSRNKYNILAKKQLLGYGIKRVEFLDLEKDKNVDLSGFGIVYVCGGNTFKLMKHVNGSNFKDSIKKFLKRNGLYIGVSAGSVILGPSIEISGWFKDSDENIVNLEDLSGMGLLPYAISPHFKDQRKKELEKFNRKSIYKTRPLTDEDVIYIK